MINLNDAEPQKERVYGPIPAKSLVKVKLEIRQPKAGKADADDPAVTVYSSGLKGLDCEFTVTGGKFEGVRIWENLFLPPAFQTIDLSKGQAGICNSSYSKMRAMVEAARGLDPNDPAADRNLASWFDLHGLEIPVKVGMNKIEPGDEFINNNISKVLTPDAANFKTVMAGGEAISDEPIPELGNKPAQHDPGAAEIPMVAISAEDPNEGGPYAGNFNVPDWAE